MAMASSPAVASFVTNPGIPRGQKAKTLVRAQALPVLTTAPILITADTCPQLRAEGGCWCPPDRAVARLLLRQVHGCELLA